ncbi:cell envelope integrity protein CreD [Inquilinus sp. CAU 1745]|uniref:cell envelope integrity protein CreD n=1 Tax=Inquilinus sp. CAU 1745 TaxID=3140369 RepID=UPI00325B8CE3
MTAETPRPSRRAALVRSPLFKVVMIGVLTVVMLLPLFMIEDVIHERQGRYRQAVAEIGRSWGDPQTVIGPILAIPYRETLTDPSTGRTSVIDQTAYVLPDQLSAEATLAPEVRRRGLFEAAVYTVDLSIEGAITPPTADLWADREVEILWRQAEVILLLTDQRSVDDGISITVGDRAIPFEPGVRMPLPSSGVDYLVPGGSPAYGSDYGAIRARTPGLETLGGQALPFATSLSLRGSDRFMIAPVGRQTDLSVAAPWPDPSFIGAFLPSGSTITEEGFDAQWSVSYFGRSYPQSWLSSVEGDAPFLAMPESTFGVRLYQTVDTYQQVERSAKYGMLFVVFTFTALFLFEVTRGRRVHIIQYGLVGLALCIFYLLLLSFAERFGFGPAYALGTAAIVTEIGLYARAVMGGWRPAGLLAAVLAGLYAALYLLLQLEDLALMIGSIGLFVGLGAVMYATRRIDWHGAETAETGG